MSHSQLSLASLPLTSLNSILPKPLTFITIAATLSFLISIVTRQSYLQSSSHLESTLQSLEIVQSLRSDPSYIELERGYSMLSDDERRVHLTAGTLSGKGKLEIEPLVF